MTPAANQVPQHVWHVAAKGIATRREYRWGGALTVNVYDHHGREVDVFTMDGGDYYGDVHEFLASVEQRETCAAGEHRASSGETTCPHCGAEAD